MITFKAYSVIAINAAKLWFLSDNFLSLKNQELLKEEFYLKRSTDRINFSSLLIPFMAKTKKRIAREGKNTPIL